MTNPPPVWLRGPIAGVTPLLQPVAHALVQADEEIRRAIDGLSMDQLWARPGGAAAIGFHVRHAIGSLDRLLTYARGDALNEGQLATLAAERRLDRDGLSTELAEAFSAAVALALAQLRDTPEDTLLAAREVGRARRPSNVIGLLVHAAEHTAGHVAQTVTTAKILRGS
jgi:hypothetical protein